MIKKESIEELKQNLDIVDIISQKLELHKAGMNYTAMCPFHPDKNPSLVVSPEKNFFKCFGCGKAGDSITFIMEYEKLDFADAIESLADIMNFKLEYDNAQTKNKQDSRILEEIATFYAKNLQHQDDAKEYLSSRALSLESIQNFQIGYCGASVDTINFIRSNNLDMKDAKQYGIIGVDQGNREYARFTQRIIFPIRNSFGKVVGFGGRTLKENIAKYINSAQSSVFNKSSILYAYDRAKESIFKEKRIIICEGYLDVVMLHQAGFKNAVATLGTALTEKHVPLLKRGSPKIIVSFDGDGAGINATLKVARLLAEFDGGVVVFEDGKDPADMVSQNLIEELKNKFNNPMPFIDFVFEQIYNKYNLDNKIQKKDAIEDAIAFLCTLDPILQNEYKKIIAYRLSVPEELIKLPHKEKQGTISMPAINSDLSECVLLKSLLCNPEWQEVALDYIDKNVFVYRENEFNKLLTMPLDEAKIELSDIYMNDNVKPLKTPEELKDHVRLLLLAYNNGLLKAMEYEYMDSNTRLNKTKDIISKIEKLKKGIL